MKSSVKLFAVLFIIFFFGTGPATADLIPAGGTLQPDGTYRVESGVSPIGGFKTDVGDTATFQTTFVDFGIGTNQTLNAKVVQGNNTVYDSSGDHSAGPLFETGSSAINIGDMLNFYNTSNTALHFFGNIANPDGSGVGCRLGGFNCGFAAVMDFLGPTLMEVDIIHAGKVVWEFTVSTAGPVVTNPVSIASTLALMLIGFLAMAQTFRRKFSDPGGAKMAMT